ncbi:MAG: large conductance mechanosensitive channel protein MscL [Clostridia bacterium]|nr:large conductance mechanosensitive channel protein MscL [Clostridia bacterium]
MKKFFEEFKVFITRGNVLDMAVGVIVGSSFTAIVNALSTNIIKPFINWIISLIFGADTLSESFTFLKKVLGEDGAVDLTQSIYIDWGLFINAVINFFIVAIVLFTIIKAINSLKDQQDKMIGRLTANMISKEDKKAMKEQGIDRKDKAAVKAYFDAKALAEEEAKKAEEEAAAAERAANPTTEDLLKEIRDLLKK